MSKYSETLKKLSGAFPDLSTALTKSSSDLAAQKTLFGVLDILLNAKAPKDELRAVAQKWSVFSDDSGTSTPAFEVFERLNESDPEWTEAKAARIRLLLHANRPVQALKLLDAWKQPPYLDSLRGICLIRSDPKLSMELLEKAGDLVNVAALKELEGASDPAKAWTDALAKNPTSLAALNGAKKFNEVIEKQRDDSLVQSEFDARISQGLTGLGVLARLEFPVTAEGLFRSAISGLERSYRQGKKPAYNLQLSTALHEYGTLLRKWDRRETEGDKLIQRAKDIRDTTSSFLPSFAFDMRGWSIDSN